MYVIFGLMTIGILASISANLRAWAIPLLVFGLVYLLYKFPPDRLLRSFKQKSSKPKKKYKQAKFRVIDGQRRDDEPPTYH